MGKNKEVTITELCYFNSTRAFSFHGILLISAISAEERPLPGLWASGEDGTSMNRDSLTRSKVDLTYSTCKKTRCWLHHIFFITQSAKCIKNYDIDATKYMWESSHTLKYKWKQTWWIIKCPNLSCNWSTKWLRTRFRKSEQYFWAFPMTKWTFTHAKETALTFRRALPSLLRTVLQLFLQLKASLIVYLLNQGTSS